MAREQAALPKRNVVSEDPDTGADVTHFQNARLPSLRNLAEPTERAGITSVVKYRWVQRIRCYAAEYFWTNGQALVESRQRK